MTNKQIKKISESTVKTKDLDFILKTRKSFCETYLLSSKSMDIIDKNLIKASIKAYNNQIKALLNL